MSAIETVLGSFNSIQDQLKFVEIGSTINISLSILSKINGLGLSL